MRIKRLKLSGFKSFVEPAELAAAAGVGGSPTATQWVHGPSSQALYGLFSQSSHVVRVQINGTVSRHVSSATLAVKSAASGPRASPVSSPAG